MAPVSNLPNVQSMTNHTQALSITPNVTLPAGAKNHGDPNLMCLPPTWTDYLLFFGTNYFAHVATLVERPGQTLPETLVNSANALFIPASGAVHALRLLILRSTTKRGDPLRNAAKAGALCMLVARSDIRYVMNRTLSRHDPDTWLTNSFGDPGTEPESLAKHMHSNILGRCKFNTNRYTLIPVPPDVPLKAYEPIVPENKKRVKSQDIKVQASYNVAGVLVALFQVIWGVVSLYNARANQIDLYGYGAFGLTVIPYALMSLINLTTNLFRPGYPHIYLVHTPDMDEDDTGRFAGMIAAIDTDKLQNEKQLIKLVFDIWTKPKHIIPFFVGYVFIGMIPILVVAGMTGFRTGTDIRQERAWILAWYIVGAAAPLYILFFYNSLLFGQHRQSRARFVTQIIIALPLWVPAIGGMVIVGRTLSDFGVCARLD